MEKGAILISGASTGIGLCCAQMLADKGLTVFAGVRKSADAERLSALSPRILPVMLDITREQSIETAVFEVKDKLAGQPLTGLVNNAGIVVGGPLEFVPLEALRMQLEINLIGHVGVSQACLPLLRESRGRIVNMGSIAGLTSLPYAAPYSISKFALEAVTDALRIELAPWDIHVSVIEPGAIATPLWNKSISLAEELGGRVSPELFSLYGRALEKVRAHAEESAKKGIAPERVAEAVLHALLSRNPKTRYLVGPDAIARKFFSLLPDRLKDRLITAKLGI